MLGLKLNHVSKRGPWCSIWRSRFIVNVGGLAWDKNSLVVSPRWRHQMETFSALLALRAGNSPVPVNSPHKGQWRGALMFSLICARMSDWVNNREAGDLRRHRGHYDVSEMLFKQLSQLGIFRVRWDIDLRQFVSNLILIYIVKWKWESVLGSFIKFLDFNDIWLICMFLNSICSVDTIGSSTLIDLCRCIGEWIFHRPQTSSFGVINSSFLSMNLQPVLLLFCISYKWRNRCPKRFVSFGTFHIAK